MIPLRAVAIGTMVVGLVGGLGLLFVLGADALLDEVEPLTSWRGGGCHGNGRYSDGDDWYGTCHDQDERSYCGYHGRYFDPEEWDEHRDDCPFYQNSTRTQP